MTDALTAELAGINRQMLTEWLTSEACYMVRESEIKAVCDPDHVYWSNLLREAIGEVQGKEGASFVYFDCQELEKRKQSRGLHCLPPNEKAMAINYLIELLGFTPPPRHLYQSHQGYNTITSALSKKGKTVLLIDSAHLLFPQTLRTLACDAEYWASKGSFITEVRENGYTSKRTIHLSVVFAGNADLTQKLIKADGDRFEHMPPFASWREFYGEYFI